jgi:hypothetical protein
MGCRRNPFQLLNGWSETPDIKRNAIAGSLAASCPLSVGIESARWQ